MLTDALVFALAAIILGGRWVWLKLTGREDVTTEADLAKARAADAQAKRFHIWQGTAGFFVDEDLYKNPYAVEWVDVVDYPQDRQGAEAFLTTMAGRVKGEWFATNVVGVTGGNGDGTSRQALIAKLKPLDEVELEPGAENLQDNNEVCVMSEGHQIGFLESALGASTARDMERDEMQFRGYVLEVTGPGDANQGVNIGILRWELKDPE